MRALEVPQEWPFLRDPWAIASWQRDFGYRGDLRRELALLDLVFSKSWRDEFVARTPFKHVLPYHLATKGGWARLLDLAAELLLSIGSGDVDSERRVPMLGRLRAASLYLSTLSEIVVAPILRGIGSVTWQPQGLGHGADYRVDYNDGILVAEVKRACTSLRQEALIAERTTAFLAAAATGEAVPVFADAEELANAREDARRLYPHVRHAADQLATSARLAAVQLRRGRRKPRTAAFIPGVLLLDLDGNSSLRNLGPRIERWMQRGWAAAIDLVVFVDYEACDNRWSATVEPVYSRTHVALRQLASTLRLRKRRHLRVRHRGHL